MHIFIIIVAFAIVDINTAIDGKLLGPWDHIYDFSCTLDITQNTSTLMKAFTVGGWIVKNELANVINSDSTYFSYKRYLPFVDKTYLFVFIYIA